MCYLDVAADAEGLFPRGEEGVRHLLRGGLDLLLHLLLCDTLGGCMRTKRRRPIGQAIISGSSSD